jgi:hypothetical protein
LSPLRLASKHKASDNPQNVALIAIMIERSVIMPGFKDSPTL